MKQVARLARRPLKKEQQFNELKTVKAVRKMEDREFEQVVKCGFAVLDRVHKSIFMSNLAAIVRGHRNCTFLKAHVESPLLGVKAAKEEVKREIQTNARRWVRRGQCIFVYLSTRGKGGKNIIHILDSTTRWGMKEEKEFVRPCKEADSRMHRLEG